MYEPPQKPTAGRFNRQWIGQVGACRCSSPKWVINEHYFPFSTMHLNRNDWCLLRVHTLNTETQFNYRNKGALMMHHVKSWQKKQANAVGFHKMARFIHIWFIRLASRSTAAASIQGFFLFILSVLRACFPFSLEAIQNCMANWIKIAQDGQSGRLVSIIHMMECFNRLICSSIPLSLSRPCACRYSKPHSVHLKYFSLFSLNEFYLSNSFIFKYTQRLFSKFDSILISSVHLFRLDKEHQYSIRRCVYCINEMISVNQTTYLLFVY